MDDPQRHLGRLLALLTRIAAKRPVMRTSLEEETGEVCKPVRRGRTRVVQVCTDVVALLAAPLDVDVDQEVTWVSLLVDQSIRRVRRAGEHTRLSVDGISLDASAAAAAAAATAARTPVSPVRLATVQDAQGDNVEWVLGLHGDSIEFRYRPDGDAAADPMQSILYSIRFYPRLRGRLPAPVVAAEDEGSRESE